MLTTLKNAYLGLVKAGSCAQPFFLLATRLAWGSLFYFSGMNKLGNLEQVSSFFNSLGIPLADHSAFFVAWLETIGGLCLAAGFASRLVSIPLIITMIVAFITAHSEAAGAILEAPTQLLKESPFTYLYACLVVFVFGPGKISVDYALERVFGVKIDG